MRETTDRPLSRLTRPLARFLHTESSSGIVLLVCTAAAVAAANSPLADSWMRFWNTVLTVGAGRFSLSYPLWYWVNDGLMTVFFFLVGLEIKRELVSGELREARRVIAPTAAAVGGAAAPAILFFALQHGQPGQSGWAIPMATDIAFVVGLLALLGDRVPRSLKVFLLTLAIIDDLIAVLVIALFYSSAIKFGWLLGALAGFGVVAAMKQAGVRAVAAYGLAGVGVWLCTLKSGIHPTVSGAALGFLTPARPLLSAESLAAMFDRIRNRLRGSPEGPELHDALEEAAFASREAVSPLERLETAVHPWSAFLIMPVFALANAGVPFAIESLTSPIASAIAVGLVLGKPAGVL
ncbi:MAG TPA: Na+/H+ antiporter NhaA, partial [candidate division Zixibacteria bacterium]|nr:Na+/H+ antiporter NhaA [candidate division Zixibacteria bacterium]